MIAWEKTKGEGRLLYLFKHLLKVTLVLTKHKTVPVRVPALRTEDFSAVVSEAERSQQLRKRHHFYTSIRTCFLRQKETEKRPDC